MSRKKMCKCFVTPTNILYDAVFKYLLALFNEDCFPVTLGKEFVYKEFYPSSNKTKFNRKLIVQV